MAEIKPDAPWMVHGVGLGPPTREHASEQIARDEAVRLARLNPGVTFRVLQVCAEITCSSMVVKEFERDAIPF